MVAKPTPLRIAARNLLINLSKQSGLFCPSLLLTEVEYNHDGRPVASGGCADVFKGTFRNQTVCVKYLRTHVVSGPVDRSEVERVRPIKCWIFCLPGLSLQS
jgi:hypothetical protein